MKERQKRTTPLIFHFLSASVCLFVFIRTASACCVNDPFISLSLACTCACAALGEDGASGRQSLPGVCDVQADYRDALKLWLLTSLVTERTDPCLLLACTEPSERPHAEPKAPHPLRTFLLLPWTTKPHLFNLNPGALDKGKLHA